MADVAVETHNPPIEGTVGGITEGAEREVQPVPHSGGGSGGGPGLKQYYIAKIEELQLIVADKTQNLCRLQAQRNELNAKVRMLREELQLLQEQGSYVGEVVRAMDKKKVLVKVHPEGKFVVDVDKNIDITTLTPNSRVALRNDSYTIHRVLPNKVDPLVSLMMVEKVPDSTYEMVGGLDKQIKEIKEVIELPVKHPELFDALGIAQPKGVLLYGPPGTGKTLLARAVAHHTECTFIRVSGSELVQKFIGEGSRMVRELFVMAREHAPSIIFMDEIDSIGSSRIESSSGGDSEVQRTMLELLNQLDGFEATKNIKVIMATNRIDILDPALLRPGRIDRKIEFPPPNEEARLDILRIHSRRMNLTRGINLRKIAESMPGASGAEVKGVCTEAGMYALRERRVHVTQEDFEMAVAKIMQKDSEKNMSIKKLWNNIKSIQALSAKNTELLRKGVQPSVLGNPIEDDEAFATVYDGPEDPSTAPGCPARTFQLPWIYYGNPERCYLAGHRGPCNSRMTMFVRQNEPIRGMCDCDDAGSFTTAESYFLSKNKTFCIHEKRRLAYFPPKKRCYYLFERGPCPFGEWLIINAQGNAVCEVRRCPKNLYDTTSYRTPFWFYDNLRDSCYQAYTRGYCPRNYLLLPTKTNWLPQCTNTKAKCDDLLPAVVAIPTLRCSPGSYCSQILDGRKHYTRAKISRRHRHRT
ncbi:unnamed protein product [Orchesella dallaii]|uniref:AAA+ ATPase domain-containing protein n=1 Tax=Orchesella dallaii TaxID=48710 RepID=A0ABP1RT64_9HEXA